MQDFQREIYEENRLNKVERHFAEDCNQYSFIDQFLDGKAFVGVEQPQVKILVQDKAKQEKFMAISTEQDKEEVNETPGQRRKKSIFHNFQKHLITLLKKNIGVTSKTFEGSELKLVAFRLWQCFIKAKSCNKKILHVIFGFPTSTEQENQYRNLATQIKEFKSIINKNNLEAVIEAQQMIRNEVIVQAKSIDKLYLRAHCNVSQLQLFLEYFQSFIEELAEGPMSKRMTKNRKSKLVDQLKLNTHQK